MPEEYQRYLIVNPSYNITYGSIHTLKYTMPEICPFCEKSEIHKIFKVRNSNSFMEKYYLPISVCKNHSRLRELNVTTLILSILFMLSPFYLILPILFNTGYLEFKWASIVSFIIFLIFFLIGLVYGIILTKRKNKKIKEFIIYEAYSSLLPFSIVSGDIISIKSKIWASQFEKLNYFKKVPTEIEKELKIFDNKIRKIYSMLTISAILFFVFLVISIGSLLGSYFFSGTMYFLIRLISYISGFLVVFFVISILVLLVIISVPFNKKKADLYFRFIHINEPKS